VDIDPAYVFFSSLRGAGASEYGVISGAVSAEGVAILGSVIVEASGILSVVSTEDAMASGDG
jgi:hypothetical protein